MSAPVTQGLSRRHLIAAVAAASAIAAALPAQAQKKYSTGATDTEIKLGHIVPYSGPVSAYGTIGKTIAGYFTKVNAEGGVNGRKIKLISLDDAYNPAKTVEVTRKLVEEEEVLAMFAPLGTAQNAAIQKYMNAKKVPHLFLATGATRWGNPKEFPWTMGWQPTYTAEGRAYARQILETKPNAKIAILMQNDDFGKDYLRGFMEVLGDKAKTMVVANLTYETSDPTIDSQLLSLKASGADVFFDISTPKFAAQAIRKVAELGWKPTHYLASVSQSAAAVLKPAGFENATGIISSAYLRDPSDPAHAGTRELADYLAFMKQYYPAGDPNDTLNVIGYSLAQTMVQTLKQCGDNLTHENLMKQAANLSMTLPMLYPGIEVKTSPEDFYPVSKIQLIRFNGSRYEPVGKVLPG
ncbi:ABC transporter substrate-binding protein [Ideonella sp. DXS22W]|uniref:ABC transporter substrate-binding protein n=1 Tax=Pseudaquabacterium inlustre TaxID=2984192 RepID=A0ABU9CC14_9BURK